MVERAGLENRSALLGTEGSNPSLSAALASSWGERFFCHARGSRQRLALRAGGRGLDEEINNAPGSADTPAPSCEPVNRFDLLKTFVSGAPSAKALFDRDLCYLAYSDRWVSDYGLDPEQDYTGRSHYEVFPEIGEEWKAAHQRCLRGEIHRTDHEPFPRADGTTQWLRYEVRPWYESEGVVGGLVMLTEDLTGLVEATGGVRQRDALFAAARDVAATLWAFDADRTMTLHVGAPLEDLGVGQGWNVGNKMDEVYAELPVVTDAVDRALAGEPSSWSVVVEGRTFESVVRPVRDDSGAVTGGVGISIDVTDRDYAQARAEAAAAEVELIQGAIPDAVVVADTDRRVQRVNPAFAKLFGYTAAKVIGQPTKLLYADPAAFDEAGRTRYRPSGPARMDPFEVEYRRADGTTFMGETVGAPVRDSAGRTVGYVGVIRDVTERRAAEDRLYHQAHHDELTGLANRTLFTSRLDAAIAVAAGGRGLVDQRSAATNFAVLYVDLDRFKAVNDTFGHSAGDALLREVADRLRGAVRPTDTVARLGGDEFAVLLEGLTDADAAGALAQQVAAALVPTVEVGGRNLSVGASIGVVWGRPDHDSSDAVLGEADLAMYEAKRSGRGRSAMYSAATHGPAGLRLRLELDLPRAIEEGELRLAYQPIVRLSDGALAGFEALVRWEHPELGLLYPDAFIGPAEESGQIVAVDRWVLREACRQVAAWEAETRGAGGDAVLVLNVNCTGRDLLDPEYVGAVRDIASSAGFDPDRLHLEITESLLIQDAVAVAEVLRGLRTSGVRFCIDDFGTGYSSLSALHALPVDRIKVDRSFVADMVEREESAALVDTVVRLGRMLGKGVVAEGIETAAHLAALRRLGCAHGQGYLFSKPVGPEAAASMAFAAALPWAHHWDAPGPWLA